MWCGQRRGHAREQYLAAVAGSRNPCRPVHIDSPVIVSSQGAFSGVRAHSNAEVSSVHPRFVVEIGLKFRYRPNGRNRGGEDHEEGVALGRDDSTFFLGHGGADDLAMPFEQLLVAGRSFLQEPGRSLDVGEHEGHDARGEIGHRAPLLGRLRRNRVRPGWDSKEIEPP